MIPQTIICYNNLQANLRHSVILYYNCPVCFNYTESNSSRILLFFFCFKFIQIFAPVNIFRQKYKKITARTKYYFCHARTDIGLLCEKRKLMLHLKLVGIILLTHVSFNCRRTETKHLKPLPSILYNYVNLYIVSYCQYFAPSAPLGCYSV